MKKITKRIRPTGNVHLKQDVKGDINTLAIAVNMLIDKVNELVEIVEKLEAMG